MFIAEDGFSWDWAKSAGWEIAFEREREGSEIYEGGRAIVGDQLVSLKATSVVDD